MNKQKLKYIKHFVAIIVVILFATVTLKAQTGTFNAQYYTDRYLANPAMAGITNGWMLGLSHRSQWTSVDGAPTVQQITGEWRGNKTGIGLNLISDRAGLQRNFKAMATYSYHIPLNGNGIELHFGLSSGLVAQRLSAGDVRGDASDPLIAMYNQRAAYFDSDFGTGITIKNFEFEAAFPNLRNTFWQRQKAVESVNTFYITTSYKFQVAGSQIEPKFVFRGLKNSSDIWDAALQYSFVQKQVKLMGVYRSSGTLGFGVGADFMKNYTFNFYHNAQINAPLSSYTNGEFELFLGMKF